MAYWVDGRGCCRGCGGQLYFTDVNKVLRGQKAKVKGPRGTICHPTTPVSTLRCRRGFSGQPKRVSEFTEVIQPLREQVAGVRVMVCRECEVLRGNISSRHGKGE